MFSPYRDKIDTFYAPLKIDVNIEGCRELDKYLGIELDRLRDLYIQLCKPLLKKGSLI